MQTGRDRVALSKFTFEMADPSHLESVIRAVRRVSGVLDAYRMELDQGLNQHHNEATEQNSPEMDGMSM